MRSPLPKAAMLLEQAIGLHQAGKLGEAEQAYRRVLVLDPANVDALAMLGLIHRDRGEHEVAIRLLRAALALQPATRHAYNLGCALEGSGDIAGCVSAYWQAVALDSSDIRSWCGLIFNADLHPYGTPALRLGDRRAFNARHCAALTALAPAHTNDPDPDRRLRVGYLSADFFDHSATLCLKPILAGHDHAAVEVFCYWQQRVPADQYTAQFETYADHWRVVSALSDDELAKQIRADGIDILVDLSGYSLGNRVLALARKPAPVIMTGWGHATGLGLDACDYLLADAVTVPPELAYQYHEQILHLPSVIAFDPRPPYPDVAPAPYERNGCVTFGYFGRATKTSELVWAVWAEILQRVPRSRLLLKGREYGGGGVRDRIVDYFASLRISSDRVAFLGSTSRLAHLTAYGQVDVALEPWPQNGGITTLEATLMGVPTVTLLGEHLNGRVAASVLATIGRPAWVASDLGQYVEIAVSMAQAPPSLDNRQQIRAALLNSIICDSPAYARATEAVYRQAWAAWCESRVERPELMLAGV